MYMYVYIYKHMYKYLYVQMCTDIPKQKKTMVFTFNGFRLWEAKMGRVSEETRVKKTKIKQWATPGPPHPHDFNVAGTCCYACWVGRRGSKNGTRHHPNIEIMGVWGAGLSLVSLGSLALALLAPSLA